MSQPQSNISQLKDFLSYLITVKGDLSNITAPPFTLSPRSVVEIPASWAERHDLFLRPAQEQEPARRSLLVLKNFLCSLKRQVYTAATAKGRSDDCSDAEVKKPLNAFLGELFLGVFESNVGSTTKLICEQVSHHPPVTACCLYNETHGISSSGYVAQETTFNPTSGVRVKQIGHAIIRDEGHEESHLMTLPTIAIKGLLVGQPYPELEGTCYISSSSGYLATIDFQGKRMLGSSKRNSVRAELSDVRDGGRIGKLIDDFSIDDVPLTELQTKPIVEQSPWESRKAWAKVAEGIGVGSMHVVSNEKGTIENAQREMRAAEESANIEWPRLFFQNSEDGDQEFVLLATAIPDHMARNIDKERTAGIWKFIGVSAAEALLEEGIFHRSLAPTGQAESYRFHGENCKDKKGIR